MTDKISLIISVNQEIIQAGLRSILVKNSKFEIVAAPTSREETLAAVAQYRDAIVLFRHSRMGRQNYLSLSEEINELSAGTKIIFLDVPFLEQDFAKFAQFGVYGYLAEPTTPKSLYLCIESVAAGSMWIGPVCETDNEDLELSADLADRVRLLEKLSPREQEVFLLLAKGFTNQVIANCLNISRDTVKTHMHNIMEKFAATDRAQLVLKVRSEIKEQKSLTATDKLQTY